MESHQDSLVPKIASVPCNLANVENSPTNSASVFTGGICISCGNTGNYTQGAVYSVVLALHILLNFHCIVYASMQKMAFD